MASHSTEQLAILVEQQHCCLTQLLELGLRQRPLIEAGDMTALLRLLASKQPWIAALQRVEQELSPFRDEDPEARVWRSPEDRARCAARADECRGLLEDLVLQEKRNEGLMLRRRQVAADRLHQVHAAARASGAYRRHAEAAMTQRADKPSSERPTWRTPGCDQDTTAARNSLDVSSDIR